MSFDPILQLHVLIVSLPKPYFPVSSARMHGGCDCLRGPGDKIMSGAKVGDDKAKAGPRQALLSSLKGPLEIKFHSTYSPARLRTRKQMRAKLKTCHILLSLCFTSLLHSFHGLRRMLQIGHWTLGSHCWAGNDLQSSSGTSDLNEASARLPAVGEQGIRAPQTSQRRSS